MSEKVHIFTPLLLTFLALSMMMQGNTACGQEGVQKMLTVEQMREDFTYMMEQYERIHPNPTWSLGEERYSKLKQQTLERLDHPMSTSDFWKIIARWNQHFDGHTWLSRLAVPIPQQGGVAFPPNSVVQYNNGKLWFSSYDAMPDTVVFGDYTGTKRGTLDEPAENHIVLPLPPLYPAYDGKLYFIQSRFTYSAAISLANIAKQYRLGTVFGEETGGLTSTYIRLNGCRLPNSGLAFYVSDKYERYFGTTGPHGVMPDIPFDIGYRFRFRSFTMKELQQMAGMVE